MLLASTRHSSRDYLRHIVCQFRRQSTHAHAHAHPHHHPAGPNIDRARAYCLELLRTNDYPSYILNAFIPSRARDANLAIRAFNIDVARVADQVSNTAVGEIRMQFWKDAVDATYAGRAPKEPVLTLLAKVIHEDGVQFTKSFWTKIIAARRQYLGNAPFTTLSALESYSESTYSSLHYLSLESLNYRSTDLDHIASHIGKAAGISAILRSTPLLVTPPSTPSRTNAGVSPQSAVLLPVDTCAQHGLRQEDVIRHGGKAEGLKDTIFAIATRANDHLITARDMLERAGKEGKGVAFASFLPAVPTSLYLSRLEKVDFDVFHPSLARREWKLPWKAYMANIKRKF